MKVYYMNGAGNDFMVIDARGLALDYPALARKCCAITGADGFMGPGHKVIPDVSQDQGKIFFFHSIKPLSERRRRSCVRRRWRVT